MNNCILTLKKILTFALMVLFVSLWGACSKEEASSPEALYTTSLCVDLAQDSLCDADRVAVAELGLRLADHMEVNHDGTLSVSASANELGVCSSTYNQVREVLDWYNGLVAQGFKSTCALPSATKSSTRGGNAFADMMAEAICYTFQNMGCPTSEKLFSMWYSDCRTAPYVMNADEWSAVTSYADSVVSTTYAQAPNVAIGDSLYHQLLVSFYEADADLALSYGKSTMYYSQAGAAAGFYDVYDFNVEHAERSGLMQLLVEVVNFLGGGEGFPIYYGTHR